MFNLIWKDILIQKKTFIFALIYIPFLLIVFNNPIMKEIIYVVNSIAITYMLIVTSNTLDEKNNSKIIINSMPIRRKDVVFSKYLAVFIFASIALIISGFIGASLVNIGINFPLRNIELEDVLISYFLVGIMYAVYYPLYFKFENTLFKFLNIILFMLFFFIPIKIIEDNKTQLLLKVIKFISNQPAWLLYISLSVISIIFVLISLLISIKIYNNKELE